jgi:hypothetical protein
LIDPLDDADGRVRQEAHAALVRLAKTDAGQDPEAWRGLARRRGWMR